MCERQVAEDKLEAVVPVQDEVLLRYLAAAVHYQLDHLLKVGLSKRNLVWVNISSLEGGEEEFAWCSIVAVWTHLGDRHPQTLQHLHRTSSLVVRST